MVVGMALYIRPLEESERVETESGRICQRCRTAAAPSCRRAMGVRGCQVFGV